MAVPRLLFSRLLTTTVPKRTTVFNRAFTTTTSSPAVTVPRFSLLRPLSAFRIYQSPALLSFSENFSTRRSQNAVSDSNNNSQPSNETVLLDGCDFEHWLVVIDPPPKEWTRDQIIDHYIKLLARVVGSEEEARMKIYSVSTKHYYAFGALISEELSNKLKDMDDISWVLPDSYLDVRTKDYGGEPFINGQAVPYDPKYHEEWVRNHQKAEERNSRNRGPRGGDRPRNFDRRQRPQGVSNNPNQGGNMGGRQIQGGAPNNAGHWQNMPSNNAGYAQNMPSPNNAGYRQNMPQNNSGYPQNMPPNMGGTSPSHGGQANTAPSNTMPNNQGGGPVPYQNSQMGGQQNYSTQSNVDGGGYQSQNVPGRDTPQS